METVALKKEDLLETIPKTDENGCFLLNNSDKPSNTCQSEQIGSDLLTKEIIEEEQQLERQTTLEEEEIKRKLLEDEKKVQEEMCYKRLNLLLSRSSIYAKFMAEKLEKHEVKEKKKENRKQNAKEIKKEDNFVSLSENKNNAKKRKVISTTLSPRKKIKSETNVVNVYKDNMTNLQFAEPQNENLIDSDINIGNSHIDIIQPALFYGGTMRTYQLEGYNWLKNLYENCVNGILADEMGLGKTIQCIAFIAHLIEMEVPGPFFVCAPLSTLPNWYSEFKRFTPDIPLVLFHGYKTSRLELLSEIKKKTKVKNFFSYPVVITSYQIALIDSKKLSKIPWKMLVIDEAHRIKNFECRLTKELKHYKAAHRLLLTGTPLQNNLTELWSLLNFILPEIFDDLQVFQSWFDINKLTQKGANQEIIAQEQEKHIVSTIHQILTPFLLRRTKVEVEDLNIPPKKEVIIYAPLTSLQQKYYSGVLNKTITNFFKPKNDFFSNSEILTKRKPKKTGFFGCDDNEIAKLQNGITDETHSGSSTQETDPFLSEVNLKLQNAMMCLRKICLHPYLISRPVGIPANEDLIKSSGKLLVLDALLPELKKRGHKVIIFSQFVSMLEVLEDYCDFRNYKYTCLNGKMSLPERQAELDEFKEDSTFIFLISTRAGGLGINIVSADTVIIFDSDWNPQSDLQAQDRCHRIGQTKPVVIYRLIVPKTVDEKIINYASAKRKLEKVIIQKGRFKSNDINRLQQAITKEELRELLESSDSCGFVKTDDNNVFTPEELEKLLDRSDMKF